MRQWSLHSRSYYTTPINRNKVWWIVVYDSACFDAYYSWMDVSICPPYNILLMLFGKLLEGQEGEENDLIEMEAELRHGLEKVKAMAAGCRIAGEDEVGFETNTNGVPTHLPRNWSILTSSPTSTTINSFGRHTSRMSLVFPSLKMYLTRQLNCRARWTSSRYSMSNLAITGAILQAIQDEEP